MSIPIGFTLDPVAEIGKLIETRVPVGALVSIWPVSLKDDAKSRLMAEKNLGE